MTRSEEFHKTSIFDDLILIVDEKDNSAMLSARHSNLLMNMELDSVELKPIVDTAMKERYPEATHFLMAMTMLDRIPCTLSRVNPENLEEVANKPAPKEQAKIEKEIKEILETDKTPQPKPVVSGKTEKPVEQATNSPVPKVLPTIKELAEKSKTKQIKPPSGLSRTQKKVWWAKQRELFPDAFDAKGNFLGIDDNQPPRETPAPKVAEPVADNKVTSAAEVVPPTKEEPKGRNQERKDARVLGIGNEFTILGEPGERLKDGFMIAKYFPSSQEYVPACVPANVLENRPIIITNKRKTAEFIFNAMKSNSSLKETIAEGAEVVPVRSFDDSVFTGENKNEPVLFVTNGASFMSAYSEARSKATAKT